MQLGEHVGRILHATYHSRSAAPLSERVRVLAVAGDGRRASLRTVDRAAERAPEIVFDIYRFGGGWAYGMAATRVTLHQP